MSPVAARKFAARLYSERKACPAIMQILRLAALQLPGPEQVSPRRSGGSVCVYPDTCFIPFPEPGHPLIARAERDALPQMIALFACGRSSGASGRGGKLRRSAVFVPFAQHALTFLRHRSRCA